MTTTNFETTNQAMVGTLADREAEWSAVSAETRQNLKTVIEQSECKTYQQFIEVAVLHEHGEDAVEELARIYPDYRNAEFIRGFAQWSRIIKVGEENGIDMSKADPTTFTTYAKHIADTSSTESHVMTLDREDLADYYSHHRIYYIWDRDKTGHGLFEWVEFEDIYDEAQLRNLYVQFIEHVQECEDDEFFITFAEFLQSFQRVDDNPGPMIYGWASQHDFPPVADYISAREYKMCKTVYYMIDQDIDPDSWFGSEHPVCMSAAEIASLAIAWGKTFEELMAQVHVASVNEMVYYGISE